MVDGVADMLRELKKTQKLESQISSGASNSGAINLIRTLQTSMLIPDSDATDRPLLNNEFLYRCSFLFLSIYGCVGLRHRDPSIAVSYGYIFSFHLLQPVVDNDILRRV